MNWDRIIIFIFLLNIVSYFIAYEISELKNKIQNNKDIKRNVYLIVLSICNLIILLKLW
mgnify:CR=1 FL=1|jgi:hypothetical protein